MIKKTLSPKINLESDEIKVEKNTGTFLRITATITGAVQTVFRIIMRVIARQKEKILTFPKSYGPEKLPNLYTNPADKGVMPLESNPWPAFTDSSYVDPWVTPALEEGDVNGMFHSDPLVASMQGLDGRSDPGTIDDYWFSYNSDESDPYTGSEEGPSPL